MLTNELPDRAAAVSRVIPRRALVLSEVNSEPGLPGLLTEHSLHTVGGRCVMGSGSVIGPERVAELVDHLSEDYAATENRLLPGNVLAKESGLIAWYVPGRRRPMHFRVNGRYECLTVPWPTLLFVATRESLHLAALASNQRPGPDDEVFHAPLMNNNTLGGRSQSSALCFGDCPHPGSARVSDMATFEAAVFDSSFSHLNGDNNLRYRRWQGAGDRMPDEVHVSFWRSAAKRGLKSFPTRHLLSADTTVSRYIFGG